MTLIGETASGQDIDRENRRRLVAFFESGVKKPQDVGRLGVEVEHHVVAEDGSPVSYEPTQGRVGVRDVLAYLSSWYPQRAYNENHDLLGLAGEEGSITLEPAAQLELSAAPYKDIGDVARAYHHFLGRANGFLESYGASLVAKGYHPTRKAQELTLIPKRRYDFMDSYFAAIGSHGDRMMRASASTQVSVDFSSEADAVRKMRVASALAPILAAITDNTPVYEGGQNAVPIRRLQLWREVDNLRCGTVPGVFSEGFGFKDYAAWLLRTPPIFVTRPSADDPQGPHLRTFFSTPASKAYGDAPLGEADVEHLASMFWPDVRLKKFVEIRPADSLPEELVLGYTALIKGVFYSDESLLSIEEELGVDAGAASTRGAWPFTAQDVQASISQIQAYGLDGMAYGTSLSSWESMLFSLATDALPDDEREYLLPLADFARKTGRRFGTHR